MSRYWSDIVHGLTPYVPGEQPRLPGLVKLNTNEHPYGPSPLALAAVRGAADEGLRLYPDPDATALKAALAGHCGVAPDQVFVGNGSDEVLAHAFHALLHHAAPVWFPDVTYSFYPVYCGLYRIPFRAVPLGPDLELRPEDYLGRDGAAPGGVIFPNPNAPTGRALARGEVARIAAANPQAVVVVDEAYVDFGTESALPLLADHPNLLVVQTFSKSRALAGLRVGFAVGHRDLIAGLERVKNSFNSYPLGRPAQAGAVAALADGDHFAACRDRVMATRAVMVDGLEALGFRVLPSTANFVFAAHPRRGGADLAAELRARAIVVRHFRLPRIEDFLRITVGTDAQVRALIQALAEILGG